MPTSVCLEPLEARRLLSHYFEDFTGFYPANSVSIGGRWYFTADDQVHGVQLWTSDGTRSGTALVKQIASPSTLNFEAMAALGEQLLFFTRGSDSNRDIVHLWSSDGTEAGTQQLTPDGMRIDTGFLPHAIVNDRLVWVTHGGPDEPVVRLWSSDGTVAGTSAIEELYQGSDGNLVTEMHAVGERVMFISVDENVWSTDGTSGGTFAVPAPPDMPAGWDSNPHDAVVVGGEMFFLNKFARQLWKSDGTVPGTVLVKDLPHSATSVHAFGEKVIFLLTDPDTGQRHIWTSDGTGAGTLPVAPTTQFNTHGVQIGARFIAGSWAPEGDPESMTYLVSTDGTGGGTSAFLLSEDLLHFSPLFSVADVGFFVTRNSVSGEYEVWRSDGTEAGTAVIQQLAVPHISLPLLEFHERDGKLVISPEGHDDFTFAYDPATADDSVGPTTGYTRLLDGVLRIHGTSGDDAIRIYRHAQFADRFVVNVNGAARSFALAEVNRIHVYGYSGDDNLATNESRGKVSIRSRMWGGSGDDILHGGSARDTIFGESGNDTIGGGTHHDWLMCGTGDDLLRAGAGDDTACGEGGADTILAAAGNDFLGGGYGDDNDHLDGGAGNDVVFARHPAELFHGDTPGQDPVGDDEVLLAGFSD